MYTCSSNQCNSYGKKGEICRRCKQSTPSYYIGKRLSTEEQLESQRIMKEEDSINWVKEYEEDVDNLIKVLQYDKLVGL